MPTYAQIALAVREIVFTTATPNVMAQFNVNNAAQIPGSFNLGNPAPIGMRSNRILLMLHPINMFIQQSRSDQSDMHGISNGQLLGAKTVGDINDQTNLVDLVAGKIREP